MLQRFIIIACAIFYISPVLAQQGADITTADENPYLQALPSWASTLERFVDEQGRTDFISLSKDTAELEKFIAAVELVSPESHPQLFDSKEKVLAYHANAYNAQAMWGVIERNIPANFSSLLKRASFFKFRKIVIGGKTTNLLAYETKVIRPLDDEPRMHFILNCMVVDCPRLPQTVFRAETLEDALQAASIEFFNEEKHTQVDDAKKELRLSGIMKFYTKDYVASGKRQDLLAYANQYRQNKVPEDYKVKYLKYDWTINQQPTSSE